MRYALAAIALIGVVASSLLGPAPAAQAATTRLDGADRFQTSVLASQRLPAGDAVFLASGSAFPDALAAAPAAAAEGAHLLLVRPDGIPQIVADELRRLAPSEIVVVGSEATLSAAVATQAAATGARVTRIGGADRVDTSMRLLDRMRAMGSAVTDVWVASGSDFPDALAAGAVAAREGHALVLTVGADAGFQQHIGSRLGGVQRFHIPGSADSVGADVQTMLTRTGRTVDRFPGADRYETAVQINQRFTPAGSGGQLVLTSGADFPDGLVGAVYAGIRGEALYLTNPGCASSGSVAAEQRRIGASGITVLGGTSTVSTAAAALVPCATLSGAPGAVFDAVNQQRANAGLPALQLNSCLTGMAGAWSIELARLSPQYLSDPGSHNTNLRAESLSCSMRGWAENIARTSTIAPDAPRVVNQWMNSAPHRANILNASMTQVGVGIAQDAQGRWNYVLNFGRY